MLSPSGHDARVAAPTGRQPEMNQIIEAAKAAWGRRHADADLAELAYDSLADAASTRWQVASAATTMIFDAPGESLVVQLSENGLSGQFCPPGPDRVTVETSEGPAAPMAYVRSGLFEIHGLPGCPIRLRVSRPGEPPLVTSWFRLPEA